MTKDSMWGPIFGLSPSTKVRQAVTVLPYEKYGRHGKPAIFTAVNPKIMFTKDFNSIELVGPKVTDADGDVCRTFSLREIEDISLDSVYHDVMIFTAWLTEAPKVAENGVIERWYGDEGEPRYIPTTGLVTEGVSYPLKVWIEIRNNDDTGFLTKRLRKATEDG